MFATNFLIVLGAAYFASSAPASRDEFQWEYIPDSEGRMHLIDLKNYDQPIEPFFNAETDIVFTLRTRRSPIDGEVVFWNDMNSIRNSLFDPSRPTMFTIHGWNGDGTASVNWRVNEGYFQLADYNVSEQIDRFLSQKFHC